MKHISSSQKETVPQKRAPVVVVLGHVDHGKTSILDYIRKTQVAAEETGKITQHISACEIEYQKEKITFIDTPGHEAFTQMRAHGARIADLALLIIAANEGFKPQTKEALRQIQTSKIPYIIVLTKTDLLTRPDALYQIEEQLRSSGVLLEKWGGDVPLVKTSVKTGEGIEELLETILIFNELISSSQAHVPKKGSWGVILESHLSSTTGIEALCIIKGGVFREGDYLRSSHQTFKIRKLSDWQKRPLKQAHVSQPVYVLGFNKMPSTGEIFEITTAEGRFSKESASEKSNSSQFVNSVLKIQNAKDKKAPIMNIILKTDVLGSQAAVIEVLKNVSRALNVNFLVIQRRLGEVSEFDLKLAYSTKALIIGFRVSIKKPFQTLAQRMKVNLILCDIIYDIEKELLLFFKQEEAQKDREEIGRVEILAVFRKQSAGGNGKKQSNMVKMIIGGKVIKGECQKNAVVDIMRHDQTVGTGKILEVEHNRMPVPKLVESEEGGLLYQGTIEVKKGDYLLCYRHELAPKAT